MRGILGVLGRLGGTPQVGLLYVAHRDGEIVGWNLTTEEDDEPLRIGLFWTTIYDAEEWLVAQGLDATIFGPLTPREIALTVEDFSDLTHYAVNPPPVPDRGIYTAPIEELPERAKSVARSVAR